MSILPDSLSQPLQQLIRHLLPCACLLCGAESKTEAICPACAADLQPPPPPACPPCAEPTPPGAHCGRCLTTPPHFDATLAAFSYEFPADRLIQRLKYGHQLALAPWFASRLAPLLTDTEASRLVPLPLHTERLRERGFNQAGEIARSLARQLSIPLDLKHCLRCRATGVQADLPLKERVRNVRGAFECSADFSGEHILLLDDVMTSGATLDECARTLKLHGAGKVTAVVVARALRH